MCIIKSKWSELNFLATKKNIPCQKLAQNKPPHFCINTLRLLPGNFYMSGEQLSWLRETWLQAKVSHSLNKTQIFWTIFKQPWRPTPSPSHPIPSPPTPPFLVSFFYNPWGTSFPVIRRTKEYFFSCRCLENLNYLINQLDILDKYSHIQDKPSHI